MRRGRSTRKPTIAQQQRMDAITEIGCIVCDALGHGFMPCQVHHLLVGGKHGQKRRGHAFTIGLCPWHHVGEPMAGLSHSACADRYGPSYAREPRRFRQEIGTDDYLLDLQNTLIEKHLEKTSWRPAA
ncbi:Ref family recombination enhancement nuclease [Stenotrophomonas maltophilia]|uniref:Ref family recombination enhancement nuclease n=1 Tax=Stenotrophomonas maltophilia TaxID=40324 RepID=UPI002E76900B|nr:Ref family recombination enhancement nuclease [Stenotrophomonas maltophilia]